MTAFAALAMALVSAALSLSRSGACTKKAVVIDTTQYRQWVQTILAWGSLGEYARQSTARRGLAA
jgi:hypothetical protein